MKTVSIGFMREDGDLGLFATLNNLDGHMADVDFDVLVNGVSTYLQNITKQKVMVLEREDAPDYVTIK